MAVVLDTRYYLSLDTRYYLLLDTRYYLLLDTRYYLLLDTSSLGSATLMSQGKMAARAFCKDRHGVAIASIWLGLFLKRVVTDC